MKYPDGLEVKLGDLIWWNEGVCVGHVQVIAEDKNEYESWGLNSPHIFIGNDHPFDVAIKTGVAHPIDCFEDEGIAKLSEAENYQLKMAIIHAKEISTNDFNNRTYAVLTKVEGSRIVEWVFCLKDERGVIEEIHVPFDSFS